MKKSQKLLLLVLLAAVTQILQSAFGNTIVINFSSGNPNWSAITTGSGAGGLPSASDSVVVENAQTLTVNVPNAVCASLQLSANGAGPGTLVFNAGSQLTVSGAVTLGVNGASPGTFGQILMTNGGTLICQSLVAYTNPTSPSSFASGNGTVQLTGNNTLPSTVFTNFNNLVISAGATTLGMPVTVTNLTQSGGNVATAGNALTVITSHFAGTNTVSGTGAYTNLSGLFETASASGVAGNLTTSGTVNLAATVFRFDGATAQVTSAIMPALVSSLTISNAAGVTLSQTTTTTNLALTKGNFITTVSRQLIVANTNNSAIIGGGSTSYVAGNLQKTFGSGTGQSFVFPIGTATAYTPVTLSSLNVGGSGSRTITIQSTDGDHPQLASSGIDTNKSANRYWALTQSGATFTNYSVTFGYLSGDMDAGVAAGSFIVQLYTNSVWGPAAVVGTPTATSTVITNYTAGSAVFAIGDSKGNQTITFNSPGNQTYGVTPITLGATASSGLTVNYSVTSGPASISGNTLSITGVGSVTIQATQGGNGSWNAATPVSQTISVAAASVTASITASNKVYDGTVTAAIATRGISGVINSEDVSLTGGAAAFADRIVGNGKTVTATGLSLTGTKADNYVLTSTTAITTANITAVPLTVTANDATREYGKANPVFTASYSGFVNGENSSVLSGAPSLTSTATESSLEAGSPYPIIAAVGTLSAANYVFICVNGQLTITPSKTGESYTFTTNRMIPDGDASGLTDVHTINSGIGSITFLKVRLKITGEFNGDLYGYLRHSSGYAVLLNRPGRTATNSAGYADSGFDVTFETGASSGDIHVYKSVTIPSAGSPLTGIWEPDGRTDDPTNATDISPRTTSLTNFYGLAASGEWTLFLADSESGGTNMLVDWGLDIGGAAYPTLTWTNPANIVYGTALGGVQLNATATYNSVEVPGTLTYTPAASSVLNAGSGQTLSVTFTPADTANFLPVTTNVAINVEQAPLTITANDTNAIYGSSLPAFTAGYSGFVNGDDVSSLTAPPAFGTIASSASSVGTYLITGSGAAGTNYTISYINGILNVTAASLVVTADDKSKTYGQALPPLTVSYSGFVNGDDTNSLVALALLTTTATPTSNAGTYPITPGGASSTNYSFTYVSGTLSVTQSLTSGAIASSANPAEPGANVTFTLTLNAVAPGAGAPSGTVNFRIDGSIAGAGALSGGVATLVLNTLAHGAHTITAEYSGDQNFAGVTNSLAPIQVINTPPVASNITIQRYPTQGVKVRLATLLASDSDADGDSFSVTVSSASTNSGAIIVNGNWVFYTPATGFTNADSFTYTITDGHGGSAMGTVTVAIETNDVPGQNLVVTDLGNGSFLVNGSGIPGRPYHMQYTDSLSPPEWRDFSGGSVMADAFGALQYTDPSGSSSRQYRSVYP